jgi:hypothetical protein
MKISFLGDISLNDNYIDLYKKGINPFESLGTKLKMSDFVIGNLECFAKTSHGENELKKPRLSTTVDTLNYLSNINLSVACLAQNHIYDHLKYGFDNTTRYLNDHNIKFFGASSDKYKVDAPIILDKDGIKVGLVNYVTNDTNPNLPEDAEIYLNIFEIGKVISDIRELRSKVNYIVLLLHWGGRVEGGLYPDWDQPILARKLIDAGADLIIGHHSHTIQPFEVYNRKYIFYSLGNFCFSDYWFEGKLYSMSPRRMRSMILEVKFEIDKYSVQSEYFRNEGIKFSRLVNYKKTVSRRNYIFKYFLSKKICFHFYFFHKQKILPFFLLFGRRDLSYKEKFSRLLRYLHRNFGT